jgi:RimJ/RimL family protein N-acetyltransferase
LAIYIVVPGAFMQFGQSIDGNAGAKRPILSNSIDATALERTRGHIQRSAWDTDIFYTYFPFLLRELGQAEPTVQESWLDAFPHLLERHSQDPRNTDLAFDLAKLACAMHRWTEAVTLFKKSADDPLQEDNRFNAYFNIGTAYWQSGDHVLAEEFFARASKLTSLREENMATQQLQLVQQWRARCQLVLRADRIETERQLPVSNEPCHLEPFATLLGPHHAHALYRQQCDSELASRAGVSRLRTVAHAKWWIEHSQLRGVTPLAILHPCFGLIGLVSIQVPTRSLDPQYPNTSARFYYWIGPHHQGRGYGVKALHLLLQFARCNGVRHLFSTVHRDNASSQRALAKLAGRALPFAFEGGAPLHQFYHLGDAANDELLSFSLRQLLLDLDSPEQLTRQSGGNAGGGKPC